MAEFTDPTVAYIVGILFVIAGSLGAGYFLAERLVTFSLTVVFLGIAGFVLGVYHQSNRGEWIATLFVGTVAVAAMSYFFVAVTFLEALAAFLIGLYIGYRTERRGSHH